MERDQLLEGTALLEIRVEEAPDHDVGDVGEAVGALLARLVWPTLTLGFMLALVQRGRASWARLVELHVPAKRYLVTTDPAYRATLARLAAAPAR